jgi:hypothetical protein
MALLHGFRTFSLSTYSGGPLYPAGRRSVASSGSLQSQITPLYQWPTVFVSENFGLAERLSFRRVEQIPCQYAGPGYG